MHHDQGPTLMEIPALPDPTFERTDVFVEDPKTGELVWRIHIHAASEDPHYTNRCYEYDAGTFIRLDGGTLTYTVVRIPKPKPWWNFW